MRKIHDTNVCVCPGITHTLLTALHLLAVLGHVVWPYGAEELDVIVAVIFGHLLCCGFVWPLKHNTEQLDENQQGEEEYSCVRVSFTAHTVGTLQHINGVNVKFWLETYIDLHLPVQPIVQQQVVSHSDTMGFHGMSLSVVIVSNVACNGKQKRTASVLYVCHLTSYLMRRAD